MLEKLVQINPFSKVLRKPQNIYLILVSLLGIIILVWGSLQFSTFDPKITFILLLVLAAASHFTASTSPTASNKSAITYSIDPAIAIAAVPFFGPGGAVLIEAVSDLVIWLIKPIDKITWKRSKKQLAFNASMHIFSIFVAGFILLNTRNWLGEDTIWGNTIPWILAAIANDQINIWLLILMLRLQYGEEINLFSIWKENSWAMPTGVLVMVVGGAVLAFAVSEFGIIGVLVFFLPVFLSALAERNYIRQMKAHMDDLESIIAERTEKLSNLMKEKDQFLAVLTHDMKSPLTSIGIYAGLIKDRPQLMIERPDMANVILNSQATLTSLVNNILDLEKLQAEGSMQLERLPTDLSSLIEETVESLMAQAGRKEIDLTYEIESRPIIIEVDADQIKRVIQNLISNAIKYTAKQGQVCLHTSINDKSVIITVQDNGYGIPKDELPFVFDRYHRVAKHKRVAAGTGLGLAITQAIVEAHDGHISVASEEGKGSTFTIKLPL